MKSSYNQRAERSVTTAAQAYGQRDICTQSRIGTQSNLLFCTQICCYSSAVLWAPWRMWWCEKAFEAPTGLLLNGRDDIYPRWLWLLLWQKWFNPLCKIYSDGWKGPRWRTWRCPRAVCAYCTLIYQHTASGLMVTWVIRSLCWQLFSIARSGEKVKTRTVCQWDHRVSVFHHILLNHT